MITFTHKGNFNRTEKYLKALRDLEVKGILQKYGEQGVRALAAATPKDTGTTANSWAYELSITSRGLNLTWWNKNINDGIPIVILIQYGHGLDGGGYVQGRDFINPVMRPIFDEIAESIWKEVTKL